MLHSLRLGSMAFGSSCGLCSYFTPASDRKQYMIRANSQALPISESPRGVASEAWVNHDG
jgi:hypothetical protein